MLGKKIGSVKKLGRKCRVRSSSGNEEEYLLKSGGEEKTAAGSLAVYVGEERQRFVVPTSYLSHPLFKILLEKAMMSLGLRREVGWRCPAASLLSGKWSALWNAAMDSFVLGAVQTCSVMARSYGSQRSNRRASGHPFSLSTPGTIGIARVATLSSKFKRQSYRDAPSTGVRDALGAAVAVVASRVATRRRSAQWWSHCGECGVVLSMFPGVCGIKAKAVL
nr:Auxin-induced protein 15A [Ipomoea batatas]